jgi:hypothetical protein
MGYISDPPSDLWGQPCGCREYAPETSNPIYDTPDEENCPGTLEAAGYDSFECNSCGRGFSTFLNAVFEGDDCPAKYCSRCKGNLDTRPQTAEE